MKWKKGNPATVAEVIVLTDKGNVLKASFVKGPSLPQPKPGQKLAAPRPDRWVSAGKTLHEEVVGWIDMPEEA